MLTAVSSAWEFSNGNGFAASGGECNITSATSTVTLEYDPRGGSGEPGDQTGDAASNVTVSTTVPARRVRSRVGTLLLTARARFTPVTTRIRLRQTSDTDTLYAQWQINTVGLTYDPQGVRANPMTKPVMRHLM